MITTISENTSVRVVQGFTNRLNEILEHAGYRTYGRQKVVAQFTGLTTNGVKKMYQEDRPPRPETLDKLLDELLRVLDDKGIEFTKTQLKNYLLYSKGTIAPSDISEGDSVNSQFDIADFVRADPVYTSQVIIKIDEKAKSLGIAPPDDIKPSDMKLIRYRIISYCHKNRPAIESEKVDVMIESLIELATQQLL